MLEENLTCPHCGVNNVEDAVFCAVCGKPLKETEGQVVEVQEVAETAETAVVVEEKPRKKFPWLIVVIVVLVLVAAVAAFLLLNKPTGIVGKWQAEGGMPVVVEFTADGKVLSDGELFATYKLDTTAKPYKMTLTNAAAGNSGEEAYYIYDLPDANTLWLDTNPDNTFPTEFSDLKLVLVRQTVPPTATPVVTLTGNAADVVGTWSDAAGSVVLEFTSDGNVVASGEIFATYTLNEAAQPFQMTMTNASVDSQGEQAFYIYGMPDKDTLWLDSNADGTFPTKFSSAKLIFTRQK
jgi:uncharacterized protein (DUF2147 family)